MCRTSTAVYILPQAQLHHRCRPSGCIAVGGTLAWRCCVLDMLGVLHCLLPSSYQPAPSYAVLLCCLLLLLLLLLLDVLQQHAPRTTNEQRAASTAAAGATVKCKVRVP